MDAIVSMHLTRRAALARAWAMTEHFDDNDLILTSLGYERADENYRGAHVPSWARSFEVRRLGRFSWAVVATRGAAA